MPKKKYLLAFIASLFVLYIHAQMGHLYTGENQLSSSFVTKLCQDRDGFIWIATRSGLNRYDGYQFKLYRKEDGHSGLTSNYITCITKTRLGDLYIGTNTTVHRYNGTSFVPLRLFDARGHAFRTFVNDIYQLRSGHIVVSTSGYGLLRVSASGTARVIAGLPRELSYVRSVRDDAYGRLWVLTNTQGLYCLKGRKVVGRYFADKTIAPLLRDFTIDRQGDIWVGTFGQGIYRTTAILNQSDVVNRSTSHFHRETTAGNLPISCLFFNSQGQLMIGCDGKGLYIYDPRLRTLTPNPFHSTEVALSHAKISSIIEDQRHNIWLGMMQKGIFMQPATKSDFGYMGPRLGQANVIGTNCVTSVTIDRQRRQWIGTDKDGLYLLDSKHNLIRHYASVPGTILTIHEDHEGRIWVGSYEEGCGWVSPNSDTYHHLNVGDRVSIFDIDTDQQGRLWIATMGQGLLCLDPATGRTRAYRMKPGAENNRHIDCLPNNYVSKITITPDGRRVYVATAVGVGCLDLKTGGWLSRWGVNCSDYGTFTRCISHGRDGSIYVGTNEGLHVFTPTGTKPRILTIADGLPDNGVASVTSDRRGNLWIGTDHGLARLDTRTWHVVCYYADRGLQSNEFSDGAASLSPDGSTIILGGTGGVTWFAPDHLYSSKWEGTVNITGIVKGNQEISVKPDSSYFKMDYEDNTFSLRLSTLTYDAPENVAFLYSINGDQWTQLSHGSNEIAFTHLSPGTYDFRVKAVFGGVSSKIRTFTVVIAAPWYRSTLAYIFYVAALIALGYAYLTYRKRKEQDRLQLQEHIHAEQLGEAKLRFFMNISHEIRTPMTLIVSPLLQLLKEDHDAYRRGVYEMMRRNAERILSLINQMMDLRKIDKGQMLMHFRETDMVVLVEDLYPLFNQQAQAKHITFTFHHPNDCPPVWVDRGSFDKVLMNLLSNAFKFCRPGGHVDIDLSHDENSMSLSVSDDGESIPQDKLERIFDRFYQVPTAANDHNTGTGIGLDLTRSLVELQYGVISAANLPEGKGCSFTVTLPLGHAHLRPDEMITDGDRNNDTLQSTIVQEESLDTAVTSPEEGGPGMISHKRQHIVIAEDDSEISRYLCTELEADYRVTCCPNGKEALRVCLAEIPSLLISDIMMPEMDGNTLCATLKANINTNHIPIILLTAKSQDQDRLQGLETGADAYIVKPFNMDILRRTIINLIRQRVVLRNKFTRRETLTDKVNTPEMTSPDQRLIERVVAVINANLAKTDLSVDTIATEVGISRVHLNRKMKELTNQTPHTLIRNLRLKQAATLLEQGHQSISEVMYACGFPNLSSFSSTFKNFYGLSPRDYMKQHQHERE
jgi:signal transduction histidine kinase/ligand-binding sensor domain-containing protein/DNA-binding response OmpR family regulator